MPSIWAAKPSISRCAWTSTHLTWLLQAPPGPQVTTWWLYFPIDKCEGHSWCIMPNDKRYGAEDDHQICQGCGNTWCQVLYYPLLSTRWFPIPVHACTCWQAMDFSTSHHMWSWWMEAGKLTTLPFTCVKHKWYSSPQSLLPMVSWTRPSILSIKHLWSLEETLVLSPSQSQC